MTKEQFDFFEANGFTDELITIVADEGWDKVHIENFVLMYNFQNGKHVALLIFDRDKTIYGKRGKEDGSTNKRQKSGKNSNNKEASWLHAELFFVLVSMWLPQQHMVSIWTPHGIHVETLWCPVETT